jgi:uncharacterized protein
VEAAVELAGMPLPLRWRSAPLGWSGADGGLSITAGAGTDLFVDPQGTAQALNAPCLLARPDGDFILSARVTVDLAATYDAGALVLHGGERDWAKLCLERSPRGEPTIVSVVTRGVSDDCNSFVVAGGRVWLRVSRLGPAFAFHASTDGSDWRLVRYFSIELSEGPAVGFLAQSPTGKGCTATFDAIQFRSERLRELRDGS